MRIAHVISTLDPDRGGPPVIASRLAAAQAGLGHEVHIAYHRWPGSDRDLARLWDRVPAADRVRQHRFPERTRLERLLARDARRRLAPIIDEVDVVHLHSVWESVLRVAAREARRRSKPYLVLLNGMLDTYSMAQRPWKKRLAMALGYRAMFNGAAALHVGNEAERTLIEPLHLSPPVVVIPNGMFAEEVEPRPEPGTFYASHPPLGEAPFVLFLSRLHHKKGLDCLADAFVRLAPMNDRVHLVVAGPDGGARSGFESVIAEAGLGDRVHVVGPLYGADKLAALTDATCWCLPSRQEGFTMAVNEALACGLPMVITEGCNRPDVGEAGAGLVVEFDPAAVASALAAVLDDPGKRQRMSEAGRALFSERYTWEKIATMTVEAYEGVLTRSAPAGAGRGR
ncbi:MAG: glycosyltransferase [Planctomycetota bacterium]|jgi:glycosyltransferase involved in cell wall biosynthesis